MSFEVVKVDTWFGAIEDRPGALREKLCKLADAGADLGFVIARRTQDRPGRGFVWLTGIRGAREAKAAQEAGFRRSDDLHALRVEAPDAPGVVARVCAAVADADINLRGVSAAAAGGTAVVHLAFDSADDAQRAMRALRGAPGRRRTAAAAAAPRTPMREPVTV